MFNILCVTNRRLCREDFIQRIEKIASANPVGILLREKDLSEEEYENLAKTVITICKKKHIPCILHNFVDVAEKLKNSALHLPLDKLRSLSPLQRAKFSTLGASCHSLKDAIEAKKLGATYITAGHIFDTDCKKGVPGRGIEFLKEICLQGALPVYAIGGVSAGNIRLVKEAGATGACVMSGIMQTDDIYEYLKGLKV